MPETDAISDRWIYVTLLILLVWVPLPLGSNRTWAIGILLVVALLLLAGTLLAWRRHASAALARLSLFRWPLALLGGMVLLSWLQTCELPAAWVGALSPMAGLAQAPAAWMSLSLDVFQSRIMAALSFVYFLVFVVTLLAVRNALAVGRVGWRRRLSFC